MSKFQFGNVVVVDDDQIGCIVKSWGDNTCEVYVRSSNDVRIYQISDIQHYVYSKELSDEEKDYYPGRPDSKADRSGALCAGLWGKEILQRPELDESIDNELDLVVNERLRFINANKEQLLTAFLAKTGLQPDECELIIQTRFRGFTENTTAYWVKRRDRHD